MTIQLTTNTIKLLIIDKTKKECHISFHFRNGLVQFFLHNLDIRASYNLQEDYLMENVPVNVFAYNLSCFLGFPVSYDDVLDMKEVFSL